MVVSTTPPVPNELSNDPVVALTAARTNLPSAVPVIKSSVPSATTAFRIEDAPTAGTVLVTDVPVRDIKIISAWEMMPPVTRKRRSRLNRRQCAVGRFGRSHADYPSRWFQNHRPKRPVAATYATTPAAR